MPKLTFTKVEFFEYTHFSDIYNNIVGMRSNKPIEKISSSDYMIILRNLSSYTHYDLTAYNQICGLLHSRYYSINDNYILKNDTTDEERAHLWEIIWHHKNTISQEKHQQLAKHVSIPDKKRGTKPVDNKYVYIFRSTPHTNIDETNTLLYGAYKVVKNKKYDVPVLENGNVRIKTYFCLTDRKFSDNRVAQLRKEIDSGKINRVKEIKIPFNREENLETFGNIRYVTKNKSKIYLFDNISQAYALSTQYQNAIKDYNAFARDEDRTKVKILSDSINSILSKSTWKKHRKPYRSKLKEIVTSNDTSSTTWKKWRDKYLEKENILIYEYEYFASKLYLFLKDGAFKATLCDFIYDDDKLKNKADEIYKATIEDFQQSSYGNLYFEEQYNKAKMLFKGYVILCKDFDKHKKQITIHGQHVTFYNISDKQIIEKVGEDNWNTAFFYSVRKASSFAFQVLEIYAKTITIANPTGIFVEMTSIITRKLALKKVTLEILPDGLGAVWKTDFWYKTRSYTYKMNFELYDVTTIDNISKKVSNSNIAKNIQNIIEIVNLVLVIQQLNNTVSSGDGFTITKDSLALCGAIIDLTAALLKNKIPCLLIISSSIDAVVYGMETVKYWKMKQYKISASYAVATVGSASVVFGLCLGTKSVALGSLTLSGGWIIAIGLILVTAGIAGVMYFTPDHLEIWITHCLWGIKFGTDKKYDDNLDWVEGNFIDWKEKTSSHGDLAFAGNIDMQLKSFFNIVMKYDVNILRDNYSKNENNLGFFCLNIAPLALDSKSKITLKVKIRNIQSSIQEHIIQRTPIIIDLANPNPTNYKIIEIDKQAYISIVWKDKDYDIMENYNDEIYDYLWNHKPITTVDLGDGLKGINTKQDVLIKPSKLKMLQFTDVYIDVVYDHSGDGSMIFKNTIKHNCSGMNDIGEAATMNTPFISPAIGVGY